MPQASLMTWLNKPSSVLDPPRSRLPEIKLPLESTQQIALKPAREEATSEDEHPNQQTNVSPGLLGATATLPANVSFRPCTSPDIPRLKRLNSLLLQITYPESFYREILSDPITNNITLLAFWHDKPSDQTPLSGRLVGAIRCRLITGSQSSLIPQRDEAPMLYLSTLVVLSPYRGHGIAAAMLEIVMRRSVQDYDVRSIGAHVWEANEVGLEWYSRRGFRDIGRQEGYYPRLNPQGAVIVKREIGVLDLTGEGTCMRSPSGSNAG